MGRAGDGRFRKSMYVRDWIVSPEVRLWRAVLEQARTDAELELFADGSEPFERVCARKLLRADSRDEEEILRIVCGFAEIPADRVVLWARRQYPIAA